MRELKSEGLYPKNKGLDDLLMELIFWIKEAHIARRKGYCETGPKDYPLGNIESSSIEFNLTTARLEL